MLQKKSVSEEDCSRVIMLNGRRQVVVVDRFYIVLFSALKQAHCTLM